MPTGVKRRGFKMSEERTEETTVDETETQPKALTQEDLDKAITARLAREKKSHEAEIEIERQARKELELQLQEKKASEMTESEHRSALQKSLEQTRAELDEFKQTVAEKEKAEVIGRIDASDKDALLEAGFNPKYSQVVLEELKKARGFENGTAFYKDGEGAAIDRGQVIDSLKSQYPELVVVNRAAGNNVPTGTPGSMVDPKNESTEQYIARKNAERAETGAK